MATIDFFGKNVMIFAHFWQICLNLTDEKQNLSDVGEFLCVFWGVFV